MYRDTAAAADEHDRAVGAILIGEALIADCERAAVSKPVSPDNPMVEPTVHWRAIAEAHDAYPEAWRHFDRARKVLAHRGANTAAYDELRPHARRAVTKAGDTSIDQEALDDARRAVAELKLAVPGADWAAIAARTDGLVHAPLHRRRRQRIGIGIAITVFAMAIMMWLFAIVPAHKPDPKAQLRKELDDIISERRDRIATLAFETAVSCDLDRARELSRLLVMDGRGDDAKGFGTRFTRRCGEDSVVTTWANAPRPH